MSLGYSVGDFLTTAKLAHGIWEKIRDSPDQFEAIRNEIAGFSTLLDDVSGTVSRQSLTEKQAQGLAASSQACRGVLEDLQELIDKYGGLTTRAPSIASKIRKTSKKLSWDQDNARDLRARIASTIAVLSAWNLSLANNNEGRTKILEWLSPLDFPAQQRDIFTRHQEGSGQWLLESEKFQTWLKTKGEVLLCPGNPGAGKTVLASIMINHLWNRVRTHRVGVAYMFCDYRKQREQTPLQLVGSLLKQLAEQQDPVFETLKGYYEQHTRSNTNPTSTQAWDVLQSQSAYWSRLFLIIDALDECSEEDDTRRRVLDGLRSLRGSKMVNIIVTTRPIPTILSEFKLPTHLEIRASRTDIQKYLEAQMGRFSKRIMAEKNLQADIITGILDAAEGMFLLARLNLDSLVGKTNPKAIKRALNHLPTGSDALNSAYKDAIERIESQSSDRCDLAKKALMWITYAKRLLSIKELEQAVAIELGQSDLDQDNVCDYEDIVSVCAGLVIADFDDVRPGGFLRLAHYTTQEYLVRNGMKYFPEAQQIMASSCLTYLLYDAFSGSLCNNRRYQASRSMEMCTSKEDEFLCFGCNACLNDEEHDMKLPDDIWLYAEDNYVFAYSYYSGRPDACNYNLVHRYPFHRYAAWHWGYHSAKCSQDLFPRLTRSLLNDPKRVLGIYDFLLRDAKYPYGIYLGAQNVYRGLAMHLVAFLGLPEIVSRLLEDGIAPDTEDWTGTRPLGVAIERGFVDVSELLANCCDINHQSKGREITPLMEAVRRRDAAIVQQLLAHKNIEVNLQDIYGLTALYYATCLGYSQITELLLAHGDIDVNIEYATNGIPVRVLAPFENPKISQLILARDDVEMNVRDKKCRTLIHFAVRYGNTEAVRSLLAREDLRVGTDNGEVEELISRAEGSGAECLARERDDLKYRGLWARRKVKLEATAKVLRSHFRLEQGPITTSET